LRVKLEDVGDAENERCYCANKMSLAKKRYFWFQLSSLELPARNLHHKDIYISATLWARDSILILKTQLT
jgi:hypothetical protein